MNPKELVDTIFSVDRAIRYVGMVGPGPEFELLESRMRSDLKSLTPETTDREFVEIVPQLIVGAAEKLEKDLGGIKYSLICYEKVTLAFFKVPGYTVTLSVEPGVPVRPIIERIKSVQGREQ